MPSDVTTEVVSTYDNRTVSVRVTGADLIELDDGPLCVSRVVITYRKLNGEPWEFTVARLIGQNDDLGLPVEVVVIEGEWWPEWLRREVEKNLPGREPPRTLHHVTSFGHSPFHGTCIRCGAIGAVYSGYDGAQPLGIEACSGCRGLMLTGT